MREINAWVIRAGKEKVTMSSKPASPASDQPIVPRPLSDEVADKARSVFELMERMRGSKSFGSVVGTDILITIERLNERTDQE